MDHNPWNLEAGATSQYQSGTPTSSNEFRNHDATFVQNYPLLCSVPNNQLFITAMQGGNPEIIITGLSNEVMALANSYVLVEKQLYQYRNDYDTLLEKNQELTDTVQNF